MAVLFDRTFARSLGEWEAELSAQDRRGATVEAWLFEDEAARRAAEARLAVLDVHARFRSAYKPLVHFFLEEAELDGLAEVRVRYPVHSCAPPNRFTLEAYPLAGMLGDAALVFEAGDATLWYDVELRYADQRSTQHRVFAPNRLHVDHAGATCLSPTGWIRVRMAGEHRPVVIDERRATDYESVFEAAIDAVANHDWGQQEPYFERLLLRADIGGIERELGCGEELLSTFEALHEDWYFSLLEFFQRHSGRPLGDRGLQPGQIVPDVRRALGDRCRLQVSMEPFAGPEPEAGPACVQLVEADAPLSAGCIAQAMQQLHGQPFQALSREGRQVLGLYHAGPGPAVLISGGQHANETSGVVGALRAAQTLQRRGDAHFAVIALENPDGYALHRALCEVHPRHMHHAARYSALGDDIAYRERAPMLERAAREQAIHLSGAQLHINLHGYPAHEWTRPLTGYIPRGFELWTIPKGFFLVLRHHPGWQDEAQRLLARVTARLASVPGLIEFNARQLAWFRAHSGADGFETVHGIPVQVTESAKEPTPLSLITEFPDETVYGDAFRFAHDAQTAAVLAAVEVYCSPG